MELSNREKSAFLMYRMTKPENAETIKEYFPNRIPVSDSDELEEYIRTRFKIRGGYCISA